MEDVPQIERGSRRSAGYVYLMRKLSAISTETRYPREDVTELWTIQRRQQNTLRDAHKQIKVLRDALEAETTARREEQNALREKIFAMSREFETTLTRLTDNQEVIRGIQAFARLMAQTTTNP